MALEFKEDQTAPVSRLEIQKATHYCYDAKERLVCRLIKALNQKRDSYNGIVSSLIYIIDSLDVQLIGHLQNQLICSIAKEAGMTYGGKMFMSKALYRLTVERPLFVEELFETIIYDSNREHPDNMWTQKDATSILKIQISALKAIREAEQSPGGRSTSLPQELIDLFCYRAIYCCDDKTKIDALSLVLESRSTTKPLDDRELNYFRVLYQDALSLQDPALRQIFLSLTNKLLKRINDSQKLVARDRKRYSEEDCYKITQKYMDFLQWLVKFCLDSIYCNAYFGSFILTISTMHLIIKHITFSNKNLPITPLFSDKRCYDSILGCINDSFEENKKLALDLILSLPHNEEFINKKNIDLLDRISYSLVESVNPAHSLTCQYIFKLTIGLRKKLHDCPMTKNQMLLQQLINLVKMVEDGVKETKEDFVLALKNKPVHPKLTCIRALLDYVDVDQVEKDREEWKTLTGRILNSSIDACKTVSTIVCNLNPETIGHLPMDLKEVDTETLTKTLNVSLKISDSNLNTITSQMLLISGWKTIKECSLALGSLCTRFWWPANPIKLKKEKFRGFEVEPILDSNDIEKIISFFDHYLKNLRHRGAFEQAYNGFIMVTKRIWHEEQYKLLLINMLKEIMHDFKSQALDEKKAETLKAYVTRRSAGLPFIVQAILNSEHKHDSQTLRLVMDSLFEVLESDFSETFQKIHCLNILRAVIKEHNLGEKVLPYIGKTFAVTMESFKSDDFPIRNCASMLLKSTVDRTFGVNRLRDDIHRRNQLSFDRFFKECPGLHAKMVAHLTSSLEDKRSLTAVHAVFIVLSRLKTTLDQSEDVIKLIEALIEPITKLAHRCPDYKLRELAACLATRLRCSIYGYKHKEIGSYAHEFLIKLQISTTNREKINWNSLHGEFLITKYWVLEVAELHNDFYAFLTVKNFSWVYYLETKVQSRSVHLAWIDLIETLMIVKNELIDQAFEVESLNKMIDNNLTIGPHSEAILFKSFYLCFIKRIVIREDQGEKESETREYEEAKKKAEKLVERIFKVISKKSNRTISSNLQGSLVRMLRHFICRIPNLEKEPYEGDFVDGLLSKLDIDLIAGHQTLFDKLNGRIENDNEKERLFKFCKNLKDNVSKSDLIASISNSDLFGLLQFHQYQEFQPLDGGEKKFTAKLSNTPRAIELLAFACKIELTSPSLANKSSWLPIQKSYESMCGCARPRDGLFFLINFITAMPECDVVSLALLLAGHYLALLVDHFQGDESNCECLATETIKKLISDFCRLLDQLAEGNRGLATRETLAEVLRLSLVNAHKSDNFHLLGSSLTNLFSALIKLSQDEEQDIRHTSQRVMMGLQGELTKMDSNVDPQQHSGLYFMIRFVTKKVYKLSDTKDVVNFLELMMKIILNNSKTYNEITGEKEQLFDKTKLNTFADHVATIETILDSLDELFLEEKSEKPDVNELKIDEDALLALTTVDTPTDYDTGDYSWRSKIVPQRQLTGKLSNQISSDNNSLVDQVLISINQSLSYFQYWNMLTDTEYTYHELSLYKRVAFVRFVIQSTRYSLNNESLLQAIQKSLEETLQSVCSTTLLHKCLKIVSETVAIRKATEHR